MRTAARFLALLPCTTGLTIAPAAQAPATVSSSELHKVREVGRA
jgi:hypothetical protein